MASAPSRRHDRGDQDPRVSLARRTIGVIVSRTSGFDMRRRERIRSVKLVSPARNDAIFPDGTRCLYGAFVHLS
jgi:hypothetical protein